MPTTTEELTLDHIAAELYTEHRTIADALEPMKSRIRDDEELLGQAIHSAAEGALWEAQQKCRVSIVKQVMNGDMPRVYSQDVIDHVKQQTTGYLYLDWPLRSGVRLRDATREDLDEEIKHYSNMIVGHVRNRQYLVIIRNKLKPGQKAGQVWNEKQAEKAMRTACKKPQAAEAGD